ncbi:MAG: hypothetical protein E6J13_01685 [Chloroflexi bacterium]|nr:MAG: hypothetical protein E6J13_01685 [Chloroflexota bacterium]
MRLHAAAAIVAAAVIACASPPPPSPKPSPGVGLQATFVLANPGGLVGLDAQGNALGPIVDLPPKSAPSSPALDPSRTKLVFALLPQSDPVRGFGSDIQAVNLDGTGHRTLLQHEKDNVFYSTPRFDSTGEVVYFHRTEGVIQAGAYVGNLDTVERLDLRTGQRARVLTDAGDFTIAPTGDFIVYAHLTQGLPDNLWRANIDGSGAAPFFKGKDRWFYVQSPRAAPTGCQIAFSAAGHTTSRSAHLGIPSDLDLALCDGSSVRAIATTVDDVEPAWSPSGSEIAYVGTGGLFIVDIATGNIRTMAQGQTFFFGSLVWLR